MSFPFPSGLVAVGLPSGPDGEPVPSPDEAEDVVERVVLHHHHHDVLDLGHLVGSRGQVRVGERARLPHDLRDRGGGGGGGGAVDDCCRRPASTMRGAGQAPSEELSSIEVHGAASVDAQGAGWIGVGADIRRKTVGRAAEKPSQVGRSAKPLRLRKAVTSRWLRGSWARKGGHPHRSPSRASAIRDAMAALFRGGAIPSKRPHAT